LFPSRAFAYDARFVGWGSWKMGSVPGEVPLTFRRVGEGPSPCSPCMAARTSSGCSAGWREASLMWMGWSLWISGAGAVLPSLPWGATGATRTRRT
jgi:hypothetical protein